MKIMKIMKILKTKIMSKITVRDLLMKTIDKYMERKSITPSFSRGPVD